MVKEEWQNEKKYRDVVNDAKLQGIVSNQCAFEKLPLLFAKHTGSWLIVRGTTVTSTVTTAKEFCNFYVIVIALTHLTFKRNATVACRTFMFITPSSQETELL